jgi:hypothetical protein
MSDRNIISVFKLTMPWIFNRWLSDPSVDIFKELQFNAAYDNFGAILGSRGAGTFMFLYFDG